MLFRDQTNFLFGLLLLTTSTTPTAFGAVVWSENFDAASIGQAITAAPLGWTSEYGQLFIGSAPHIGWTGNSIVGSAATEAPDNSTGAAAKIALPEIGTTGTVSLQYDAWAPTEWYGSYVNLLFDNGASFIVQAWTNSYYDNVWHMQVSPELTGLPDNLEWFSASNFLRDHTAQVSVTIDYDLNQFLIGFSDGTNTWFTPTYSFIGSPRISALEVYVDTRGGPARGDFDNFQISGSAVPLPATLTLLFPGIAVLLAKKGNRGKGNRKGNRVQTTVYL